jgi:hypothetical protein
MIYGHYIGLTDKTFWHYLVPKRPLHLPFNQTGQTIPAQAERDAENIWNPQREKRFLDNSINFSAYNYGKIFVIVSMTYLKRKNSLKQNKPFKPKEFLGGEENLGSLMKNCVKWRLYRKFGDYGPMDINFDSIGISLYNDLDIGINHYFLNHANLYLSKALEDYSMEGFSFYLKRKVS